MVGVEESGERADEVGVVEQNSGVSLRCRTIEVGAASKRVDVKLNCSFLIEARGTS
jgi:hypothetical protein